MVSKNIGLSELVRFSEEISSISSNIEKIKRIKDFLGNCKKEEIPLVSSIISGEKISSIFIGYSTISEALESLKDEGYGIEVKELFDFIERGKNLKGEGTRKERISELSNLFSRCKREERIFLAKYLIGELKHGAGTGIVLKALSSFFGIDEEKIKVEYAKAGSVFELSKRMIEGVEPEESLPYLSPVHPMLAYQEESIPSALKRTGFPVICDFKIDGVRIIVSRKGEDLRIFSRKLRDLSEDLKEFAREIKKIPFKEFIIDGELIAEDESGKPYPFQEIISYISKTPSLFSPWRIKPYFFDVLKLGNEEVWKKTAFERREILKELLPSDWIVPYLIAKDEKDVSEWMEESIKRGHEGLVLKKIDSPYYPGKRTFDWIKLKKFFTLDLVIIGAEWGHGRRKGWLSDYHLGIRKGDKFLMVGKTFKGLTDEEFKEMTSALLNLKKEEMEWGLIVEPKIVVEVAFDEIQKSNRYDSGFSLRFARIKRIRWDKSPQESDDFQNLIKIFEIFRKRKG